VSSLKPEERLIWTDIETTGLDPETEGLLEVGFRITDIDLNEEASFHMLVWEPGYSNILKHTEDVVLDMHNKNNLLLDAESIGEPIDVVGEQLQQWLEDMEVTKDEPLCGSSVQFDRDWLTMLFPNSMSMFAHRNIDVSTVKELCKRYNPELFEKLEEDVVPQKMHRVHPDITDTIDLFEYLRDNFLFWDDGSVV